MKAPLQTKTSSSAPTAFTPVSRGLLQRKCACGGTPGPSGECESCRKKKLQRRSENLEPSAINHPPSSLSEVPPIVHEVLRSPGQPLDDVTREFMEPRFGHDFSRVRIHRDATAAEATQSVNAQAFTVGQAIVFAPNKYAPQTHSGRELLTHELTHVVQQRGAALSRMPEKISEPNDRFELEAESFAQAMLDPAELRFSSQSYLQRKVAPPQGTERAKSKSGESNFIRCLNALMQSCQWRYTDIKTSHRNRPFSPQTFQSINTTLHSYLGEGMAIACDYDNNFFCCGTISSVFAREAPPGTNYVRQYMQNYGPDNEDEIGILEQEVPVKGGSYFIEINVDVSLTEEDCCEPPSGPMT